jgi:hypothetical protein
MAPSVRFGTSFARDAAAAVDEIRGAVEQPGAGVLILFCSASYDLAALGTALKRAFDYPVVACTSSGQIGPLGYQKGGITAATIAGEDLSIRTYLISPLSECQARAAEVARRVQQDLDRPGRGRRAFGLLLADGLSQAEEALAATLYQSLGDVPIIGGSAGDDLKFEETRVYWDGAFVSGAATLAVFETSRRFKAFKVQHFRPTEQKLVTTSADPARRLVREIDGFPAADAYAEKLGLTFDQFDAKAYSRHPLLLRVGSEHYVRSIQRVNPDHSLSFFCAIAEGLVLSVGEGLDPVAALESGLRQVTEELGEASIVIGCDCILRRLEHEQRAVDGRIGEILAHHRVIGFSTYGEQYNALHVNQTLTGVAIGA